MVSIISTTGQQDNRMKPYLHVSLHYIANIPLQFYSGNRVFSKLDEIGNDANIGIRGFTTWKQKNSSNKMLSPMSIEPGTLINLWFQVQHSPFWGNLAFAT